MTDKRRLSDNEIPTHSKLWDYHIIEEINLWSRNHDHELDNQNFKEDKKIFQEKGRNYIDTK